MKWLIPLLGCMWMLASCGEKPKSQPGTYELRVFIADTQSSDYMKKSESSEESGSSSSERPRLHSTLALMAALRKACPDFTVTIDQEIPDYMILVEKDSTGQGASGGYLVGVLTGVLPNLVSVESAPSLDVGIQKACGVIRQYEKKTRRQ
jgi:hypothetical protein